YAESRNDNGELAACNEFHARPERPCGSMPARRAAQYPVSTFVRVVTAPNPTANGSAGTRVAGSISSPKKKKNIAANRSRSGLTRRCDCSATEPDSAMPTRNAPIAAETWNRCATPATSSTAPKDRQQHD